jgi:hypothetical protein
MTICGRSPYSVMCPLHGYRTRDSLSAEARTRLAHRAARPLAGRHTGEGITSKWQSFSSAASASGESPRRATWIMLERVVRNHCALSVPFPSLALQSASGKCPRRFALIVHESSQTHLSYVVPFIRSVAGMGSAPVFIENTRCPRCLRSDRAKCTNGDPLVRSDGRQATIIRHQTLSSQNAFRGVQHSKLEICVRSKQVEQNNRLLLGSGAERRK